jgi:DnaJ-class molecular chaperone
MSIAVWIKNDTDKKIFEEFECLFCQEENHQSECSVCQGAGKVTKVRSQYYMKLANSRFCDLWTNGDGSLCGKISALKLAKTIQNCNNQFNQSLQTLTEISQRALKINEDIIWG